MRRCIVTLFFGILFTDLQSQIILEPNDSIDEVILMPYELYFFEDPSNTFTLQDLLEEGDSTKFTQHPDYRNKDFKSNTSYWIKYPIHHNAKSKKVWLIEFYDQSIDRLEVYIPRRDGSYEARVMGDAKPFKERALDHKNFEVFLNMTKDTVNVYYFKIQSHEFGDLRIALRSYERFVYYALNEYMLFGIFYGMILIISLYNFLVYLAIREIKNIFYIFYILSVGLYAISLDGIGFQYLWPGHPELNGYINGITLYSVIFWSLVFTRKFLSTKTTSPRLDKILYYLIIIRTLLFVFALFVQHQLFSYRFIDLIPLSFIFFTGISVWHRGYRPARFFVLAYGMLFTGFFIRGLVYLNILPFNIPLHYSLHISFGVEMLLLTFALGDRIRILKANQDKAMRGIIAQNERNIRLQEKVNRELERKVKERTIELSEKNIQLEESNLKLVDQAKEISQINSILDLANWKLKNRIKEVLEEQLHDKTMDYDVFKTLYPDKLSCFRFLEHLKWGVNFACKKCKNGKYFKGTHKFDRRCTRCGYNESITAFTIFHGIKFPIEKAFYIAYLSVAGKHAQTLKSLSEVLQLRLSTIWSFKKKVDYAVARMGKKLHVSRWEKVILSVEYSAHQEALKSVN